MPSGKINGVKKTHILKLSLGICFFLCAFFIAFSIFYFKRYDLWFYIFSCFVGIYLFIKSFLLKIDSSCYFGSLLLFFGISGLCINIFTLDFKEVYFLISTALASIMVFLFFKQTFHLLLAFMFTYESVNLYLFLSKIINLTNFLVLNAFLLFIFSFICVIIFRKSKKEIGDVRA